MGVGDIILISICAAVVVGVLATWIVKKIKGKPTCDCGGDCSHCAYCKYENLNKK